MLWSQRCSLSTFPEQIGRTRDEAGHWTVMSDDPLFFALVHAYMP